MAKTISTKRKELSSKVPHWMFGLTYACVILAILLVGAKFALHGWLYRSLFMDTTYQAVTLTNGQTFFGQIQQYGPSTYVLKDVYYLQTTTESTTEPTDTAEIDAEAGSGLELVKLVDDVHEPLNYIILNKDQVIYWQNLNTASPIIEAIIRDHAEETN